MLIPNRARQRRIALAAITVFACSLLNVGCYRWSYQRQHPAQQGQRIPVDAQQTQTKTVWSAFWGIKNPQWEPDPTACDNKGAGRVKVTVPWYSMLLATVTLGMAFPAKMEVYCTTYTPPGESP